MKNERKMDSEILEKFLAFRKRSFVKKPKKGKGSYNRSDFKAGRQIFSPIA